MARSKAALTEVDRHFSIMQTIVKQSPEERLKCFYIDSKSKSVFVIDGHRIFASRLLYEATKSGHETDQHFYKIESLKPGNFDCKSVQGIFTHIDLKRFIKKSHTTQATMRVPPWLAHLLGKRVQYSKSFGGITIDTRWETPQVVLGAPLAFDDTAGTISFNAFYFAVYSDFEEINLGFTENTGPGMIWPSGETIEKSDWFSLLMPVRMENEPLISKVTKPSNKGVKLEKQKHETTSAPI